MRARLWLIASSLVLVSCGSKDEFDDQPLQQDSGAIVVADSGGGSGLDSGSSNGGGTDAGNGGSTDSGAKDGGSSPMDAGADTGVDTGVPAADTGTGDGAAQDGAVTDGATGDGGAGAVAMLGAACSTPLDKACTANNAADKLVCLDGKWAHNGSCDTDSRCETQKGPSQGLCVTIATGCAGKTPGATVCDGTAVKACGPDLTTLTTSTTCGTNSHCEDGTPASCKCDTGYTAGSGGTCTNADDCSSKPCGPDGSGNTCTDALNDYTCACGNQYWQRDSKTCVSRFDRVASGGSRTCAIRRDRTVACWGADMATNGATSPVQIAGITNAIQISVGTDHACVLREGGTVSCWGNNDHGQLGNGNTNDSLTTPVNVVNLNGVSQISAGEGFTCAVIPASGLFGTSRAMCWGDNRAGQIGVNSNNANFTQPQRVGGNNSTLTFNQISAGTGHACGRDGNAIRCWGRNNRGQLGNNSNTPERVPSPVTPVGNFNNLQEVLAGNNFTCVRRNGSVYCWGAPIGGGDGADVLQQPMDPIAGLSNIAQLSTGANGTHVCARVNNTNNNNVLCWGSDADGQLGNGTESGTNTTPTVVPSLGAIREVAAGARHTCVVRSSSDYEILCWGEGSLGELGNSRRDDQQSAVVVAH